ncbi:hypothetical protein RFI_30547 [Reticulomyxa filosa]|uniref:Uncharacterized protein n=1 Tax=Reticulomyxa filosa TaxID=46433 RepID=X6M1I8_RETFI|nr:hypothetical protein RFI_30547 [Reticulomyxa filosa]|eukprot:ETO06845.1 hypothetical protein RFI_30547 [Reticulomyxa filosa]
MVTTILPPLFVNCQTTARNGGLFLKWHCILLNDKIMGQSQPFFVHLNILSVLSVSNLDVSKKKKNTTLDKPTLLQMVAMEYSEDEGTNTEKFLFYFEKKRRKIRPGNEPPSNYQSTDRSSAVITKDTNTQDDEFELNRQKKINRKSVVDMASIIVLKNGFEIFFGDTLFWIETVLDLDCQILWQSPDFGKGECIDVAKKIASE